MKFLYSMLLVLLAVAMAMSVERANPTNNAQRHKVGENPCTWGPSYWCPKNTKAANCNWTHEKCVEYGHRKA